MEDCADLYRKYIREAVGGLPADWRAAFYRWFRDQAVRDGITPALVDEIIADCRRELGE